MLEKEFNCGQVVTVTEHIVSFEGKNPSNVDYYYSDKGYGRITPLGVAMQYHENFCLHCGLNAMRYAIESRTGKNMWETPFDELPVLAKEIREEYQPL